MANSNKIKQALERIRRVISEESRDLSRQEWCALRDELEADAEGWRMERQEENDGEDQD